MDDVAATARDGLYDADFYAWTQEQARLLKDGQVLHADLPNIIEEIESLGRQQVAELRSRLTVLLQHLLKEIFQREKASRSWRTTIVAQRQQIARHIRDNPSLKAKQAEIFAEAYEDACALAASETGLAARTFPVVPPFSLNEALDPVFWPGQPADDHG